ncbi:MAG: TetR/AcrR family transcriptional regulator [Chitinivibrionales bacterium]|nr:TetR/AcrR family transcriptional regulator [Chitinivibrionales bacterium]
MPKAWSEREKTLIKKALHTEGRKLFEKFGLQKTTIDEIVQAARISKGAFYHFYPTKEELYFDILENSEQEFREKLFSDVFPPDRPKQESFKKFLRHLIEMLTSNPLYRQLNGSDYEYLKRKLPEETLQKHLIRDQEATTHYFKQWMQQGWMKEISLDGLNGLLLSLVYCVLHRDDFGGSSFDATKELWIDMLAAYLIPSVDNMNEIL